MAVVIDKLTSDVGRIALAILIMILLLVIVFMFAQEQGFNIEFPKLW